MGVLWYILIFLFGVSIGFLVRAWIVRRQEYSGTIHITHSEEKTLYSLELEEYPETIELKKQIVFKVDASDVDLNRE